MKTICSPFSFSNLLFSVSRHSRMARLSFWIVVMMIVLLFFLLRKWFTSSRLLSIPTIKVLSVISPEEIPVLYSEANLLNSSFVWLSKSFRSTIITVRATPTAFWASSFVATKLVIVFPEPVACQIKPPSCADACFFIFSMACI